MSRLFELLDITGNINYSEYKGGFNAPTSQPNVTQIRMTKVAIICDVYEDMLKSSWHDPFHTT